MRNSVDAARELSFGIQAAEKAVCGLFFSLYSSESAPTKSDVSDFIYRSADIARKAISDATKMISDKASEIASEAASKAHSDATGEEKSYQIKVNCKEQMSGILSLFEQFITEGASLLNYFSARAAINYRAGWSKSEASALAKKGIAVGVSKWSKGHIKFTRFPLSHAVFLIVAGFLKSTYVIKYISTAVAGGAKKFRIVQPGHKRDGRIFDAAQIPAEDFHPQSRAVIAVEA